VLSLLSFLARQPPPPRPTVAWGRPDPALSRLVCQSLVDSTPAIVIPADPRTHAQVLAWLRSHHVPHHLGEAPAPPAYTHATLLLPPERP
jgi:hypothetical protein